MRASILKFVLFSIVICSFEYAPNGSNFVNERIIYLERNVINFRNNRILADADKQLDLNDFYNSTLELANHLNDCNDDKEMACLRNMIDSHANKNNESNTLPDLNNVDEETKKLIHELQKELEKVKKELDKKGDKELATQTIQNKKIIKKDENASELKYGDFKQLKKEGDSLKEKNNEIASSGNNELKNKPELNKPIRKLLKKAMLLIGASYVFILAAGFGVPFLLLFTMISFGTIKKLWKHVKVDFKASKILRISK
ncbi:fam-b protein [Plasmodium vinckei brucechwatti]|uniref:Fam-b protein n=1 Tax=Plasmodium vinckei brucechwatti TaxID=119398 RepID=A0A6V7RV36_PLAVN|nr:fam-b protein [Plasmodium vinckei brucechwatti]